MPSSQNGRFGWTHWLLGLSIGLNLFFAAFIGAQAWRIRHSEGFLPVTGSNSLATGAIIGSIVQQIASKLPPDDARTIHDAFAAKLPELIALQQQSRQAIEQLRVDIVQRPYDNNKSRTDVLTAREARQKLGRIIEETLLEVLPRMSDGGRLALSQYRLLLQR